MNELPRGWEATTFGEAFDFKGGSQPPKSTFFHEPGPDRIRLLQIRDFGSDDKAVYIEDNGKWPRCEAHDVMVGRYGASVGKVLSGKAGAYNVALVKWIFEHDLIDRDWVEQLLHSKVFQEPLALLSRSAQNGFNKGDVEEFPLTLPPLAEQRRIVEKLDRLTARSRAAKDHLTRVQTLATRAKQATLAAAFRGELTASWRSNDNTKQSDEMPFAIPSSWDWRKAEELCDWITKGTTPKKIDLSTEKGDVPFIKVYNLTFDGSLDFTKEPTFVGTETHHGLLRRSKIYPGDILMNIVGPPLGKVSIVPDTYPEWNMNQAIAVFRPRQMILHGYLIQWLLSATYLKWAQSVSKATAGQRNLTLEICRNSPVPLPPLVEQTEIVRRIEAAFARIDRMVEEASRAAKLLERLEAELLAKAFRGELVPQDPTDEPASVLLARIREARANAPKPKRTRKTKST